MRSSVPIVFVGCSLCLLLAGCSGNDMTKNEIDAVKHSPPMTDADRKRVAEGMAAGAEKARQQENDWGKQHPEQLAKVNAERAKYGLPPVGG